MTDHQNSSADNRELPFQKRVVEWLMACFSMEVCRDGIERNHRFLEEALELVQSLDCTRSEAHQLVDYVFNRPVGDPKQELGGTLVTLTALANCHDMDMMEAGETELARVWTKIDKIRAKQAAKPKHSPLPEHVPTDAQAVGMTPIAWFCEGDPDIATAFSWKGGTCQSCDKARIPVYSEATVQKLKAELSAAHAEVVQTQDELGALLHSAEAKLAAHNGLSADSARQVRPELNLLTIGNTSMADKSAGTTDAGCGAAVITPWAVDNEPGRDFSLGLKSLSGLRTLTPEQSDFLHDAAEEFERLRDLPQATRESIAECMWRAEYRRAASKERSVPWSEVAPNDQDKYLFVADAILALSRPTYCTPDGPANCEAWAVDKRCPTCPVSRPHSRIGEA